jgi:VanZ family protein
MRKDIKQLLERNSIYFAFGTTFAIGYLSLAKLPIESFGLPVSISDKLLHVLAYAGLSYFWFLTGYKYNRKKQYFPIAFVLLFLFGVLLEYLQMKLTTYRFGELLDILVNTMVISLAAVFFKLFYFRYP